ncbi:MAG: serine protease, partial [Dysgonamonadaceae bacterium]|nr:serine protease [Dysgonamonadaceae bacterium]
GEVINNELGLEFIGTGFLLEDGRFVTARHVVEPWYYFKHIPFYKKVNEYAFNGGEVSAQYQIISPTGRKYSFTNRQIICNRANDRTFTENGITYTEATSDRYDWAYFQTSESGGLKFDNGLSGTLEQGMQLAILGYPKGQGADDIDNLHPSLSQGITTFSGVNTNGMIISSNIDIIGGNSGSPVLAKKGDGYVVVGVVSGLIYQKGVIVPVREVR